MKYVYILLLMFSFTGCSGQQKKEVAQVKQGPLKFEMVGLPSILTAPAERADYLIKHYWDNFDFEDVRYTQSPEITEQAFVDYLDIMPHASSYDISASSIKSMLRKAEADSTVYTYFLDLYEQYLYDPNSPMRNEEYYIPVLEEIVQSDKVDAINKIRPAHRLEIALRNRVGEKATDITYTLANGKTGKLYDIVADNTILYFYNPDCHTCKETSDEMAASTILKEKLQSGKLKILAIYPDEDLAAWKNHLKEIPTSWINSYDAATIIKDENIYDLKAIPTLYLLDKEKKVILKDTTYEELADYLQNN